MHDRILLQSPAPRILNDSDDARARTCLTDKQALLKRLVPWP
jgi:hypothetical protein